MDKQLLKAYIRTIVEEEVERILPKMLSEAVNEVKRITENTSTPSKVQKQPFDKRRLAQMIGYDGETITATTAAIPLPENAPRDVDEKIVEAVTKDYSAMMKKLGLT